MNKQWLVLLLSAMMVACSSNDEPELNDNKLVKIEIGTKAPSLQTKAAIGATGGTAWIGSEIAVLGMSKTATAWSFSDKTTLFNGGAVTGTIAAGASETEQAVTFASNYYYPDGDNQYTFYGYAPNANPELSNNVVTASYTLDGTQDILYAKAIAPELSNAVNGYNANYFRTEGAVTPDLAFKHKLTRFTFEVFAGNQETVDNTDYQVEIVSIKLVDATDAPLNDRALLKIAELNAGTDTDGQLTGSKVAANPVFTLKDMNGADATAVTPAVVYVENATGTKMGESIMVLPNVDQKTFKVQVTIRKKMNTEVTEVYEETVERDITLAGNAAFAAGYSYNVKLTVYGFTKVDVTASLAEWAAGEDIILPTIH